MEEWPTGRVERIAPGVRRLLAPNPSPFTYTGTQTYLVGDGEVAVIDPGPDDKAHIAAMLDAVRGERGGALLCPPPPPPPPPPRRPPPPRGGPPIRGRPPPQNE